MTVYVRKDSLDYKEEIALDQLMQGYFSKSFKCGGNLEIERH